MFTKDELIEKIYTDREGSLELPYEDACTVQKILVDKGYCVLMSGGDCGEYEITWNYAGDTGNLDFADKNNVVFCSKDYVEMLIFGDYEEKENGPTE